MSVPAVPFALAPEPEAEAAEAARKLFEGPVDFVKGVVALDGLPPGDRPEFCLAGRSNVGKSSLINAMTRRKALARASNTPGRTQELNFFDVGGKAWMVDLPGYGFAKAPVKVVAKWQALLKAYLSGRATLRRAFLLIDARHGPKAVDHEIMELLDRAAVSFQVVLTKIDKPRKGDVEAAVEATKAALARHPAAYPEILATSSETGEGLAALRAAAASLLERAG